VLGGWLGAKFAVGASQETLRRTFGGVLLLVSLKMIFSK
jgi:uncharacterized membrane protein YfcA